LAAALLAAGFALFAFDVVRSYRRGQPAAANPWNAPTLERVLPPK